MSDDPTGLVTEDAFRWPAEPLARGGMALVYVGEDRRLDRDVILKTPRQDEDVAPEMVDVFAERLVAESRVLARLQHPSIVTIYEMGRATTGTPFCVLEKVEGRALRDLLEELDEAELDGHPRTRERMELLQSMVSIAEAIAYAHERGIVHRDITPNNILVGARGEPTLIDWGLAKDTGSAAEVVDLATGATLRAAASSGSGGGDGETLIAGTPPYVSFEQTRGKPADPAYDVYSFGVTLYEVVSGRTPFPWMAARDDMDREQRLARFLRWLERGEAAPPALRDNPELSGIIARAIAHDVAERFNADELLRALKQYLTGELVFSHRYTFTGRIARWVRRHRGVAISMVALIGALVAVGMVTLALITTKAQDARDRAQEAQHTAELQEANQETARQNAELGALASAAKLDASDKAHAAQVAAQNAAEAEARAHDALVRGENADTLRAEAEKQRALAQSAQSAAEDAAKRAQGDASDAEKKWTEAMGERDAAVQARAAAEEAQAQEKAAREKAEAARDASAAAQAAAEQQAAQEKAARVAAEQAATAAQSDKVAADEAKARAESERDAAQKRAAELEARVKELEASHGGDGSGGGSGSGSGGGGGSGDGSGSGSVPPATPP